MTKFAVTGASGHLAGLALNSLLERGVDPGSIVALTRTPANLADLAMRGIEVREADFWRPETLAPAVRGVERLLLVSLHEMSEDRFAGHRNMIEAAVGAGVESIVYTSILNPSMRVAHHHKQTEDLLIESGVDYTILRNSWYSDGYVERALAAAEDGFIEGPPGTGRIAMAERREFAEAAAAALVTAEHRNRLYELGGESISFAEMAATIERVMDAEVVVKVLSEAEYERYYLEWDLPAETARAYAESEIEVGQGALDTDSDALARLLGREPATFEQTLRESLAVVSR